jgi:DNA modification methylase
MVREKNKLYFGDNLDILRRYVGDESVHLIYLDPPFNSDATYNVLFKEHNGTEAAAQIRAFQDTWHWDQASAWAYQETVEAGGRLSEALQAFRKLVGDSDMLAYLSMMAPRLKELHRVLKPTGSIYLHCDPTASHYLRLLMDAVFGAAGFQNEITWKRSSAHSDARQGRRAYGNVADTLLYYRKGDDCVFNTQFVAYSEDYLRSTYCHEDPDGRKWKSSDLTGPGGAAKGNPQFEFLGVARYWRYTKANLERLLREGRIHQSRPGAVPRMKHYLDEMPGVPLQNIWDDIPPIGAQATERLGYPTQKPLALLQRMIKVSSNEGHLVLDPFCGCGTTIDAAQKLGRRWIGIDITHLAINLIRHRLKDTYGEEIEESYEVIGEPTSVPDARVLADQDPFQFQWWALGLVGARPVEKKKGADKGIDGRLYFHDDPHTHKTKQVVFSVKAGKTNVSHVRDLRGVVERENAEMGVLISMHNHTKEMRAEAAAAGFYVSPWGKHPRIQLLTVGDLLRGARVDIPPAKGVNVTFKKAPKKAPEAPNQMHLSEAQEPYGGPGEDSPDGNPH